MRSSSNFDNAQRPLCQAPDREMAAAEASKENTSPILNESKVRCGCRSGYTCACDFGISGLGSFEKQTKIPRKRKAVDSVSASEGLMFRRTDAASIAAKLEPYHQGTKTCCKSGACIGRLCDTPAKLGRLKSCLGALNAMYYAGNQLNSGRILKSVLDKATTVTDAGGVVLRFDHRGFLAPDVPEHPIVCAKAWEVLHDVSHTRRLELQKGLQAPDQRIYRPDSKDRKQEEHARVYLSHLFDSGICEEMPMCENSYGVVERHLPPFMNATKVYEFYQDYCKSPAGLAGKPFPIFLFERLVGNSCPWAPMGSFRKPRLGGLDFSLLYGSWKTLPMGAHGQLF
jgi:hypothetical protein